MESGFDTQSIQNFLKLAKCSQTKDDFLAKVRQFDQKFLQNYHIPNPSPLPNIPRSNTPNHQTIQKTQPPQPLKNPFISSMQEQISQLSRKYKLTQQQKLNQFNKMNITQLNNRKSNSSYVPYSKSQSNFYTQQQQPTEHININTTLANQFYQDNPLYRPTLLDKSYSNNPSQQKFQKNYYQPQQYIQNNQFLTNYDIEQPQFVKYYKKNIPLPNNNNKNNNYTPVNRLNPFKS